MSSNDDPAATRDQEVKEPEEVEVGEGSAEVGEQVAVGEGDEGGEQVAVGEGDEGGEQVAVGGGDETTTDVAAVVGLSPYTDLEVAGLKMGMAFIGCADRVVCEYFGKRARVSPAGRESTEELPFLIRRHS